MVGSEEAVAGKELLTFKALTLIVMHQRMSLQDSLSGMLGLFKSDGLGWLSVCE